MFEVEIGSRHYRYELMRTGVMKPWDFLVPEIFHKPLSSAHTMVVIPTSIGAIRFV